MGVLLEPSTHRSRLIILGAGAIGGGLGGLLVRANMPVVLVQREGVHFSTLRGQGLTLRTPAGDEVFDVTVVSTPHDVDWKRGDVALLCVKSQDTSAVLDAFLDAAGPDIPVVCCQNGVSNERDVAARGVRRVYGAMVYVPATYLVPGEVRLYGVPVPGMIDVGRYPEGVDAISSMLSQALTQAGFDACQRSDIMRWKYTKLLTNLANALQITEGLRPPRERYLAVIAEGQGVLEAAGIDFVPVDTLLGERCRGLGVGEIDGAQRVGGSLWQSVQRGRSVEVDHLNGEIVRLGQAFGVDTPLNEEIVERVKAVRTSQCV